MHLFINGLSASAGAGLTYLRNVIPELSSRPDVRASVIMSASLALEFADIGNISCLTLNDTFPGGIRFLQEQIVLPQWIKKTRADILISIGNFALKRSPVPQILLSGNSLYTSKDFIADLRRRGDYSLLFDTAGKKLLAKRSLLWADCTVAPSYSFANELTQWSGQKIKTVYHGFDRHRFLENPESLSDSIRTKLDVPRNALRLVFVSHYNYYRNFETLFAAIPILKELLPDRDVRLFLTCSLGGRGDNPGSYKSAAAAEIIRKLNIGGNVIELGAVPYGALHELYRSADIYVTAAYAETFAHPLVEAMASGLPVVASDLPVHREICGGAAVYFDRFSPSELANQVRLIANSSHQNRSLAEHGLLRSKDFSWRRHVDQILALAHNLRDNLSTLLPAA